MQFTSDLLIRLQKAYQTQHVTKVVKHLKLLYEFFCHTVSS